MKKTTGCREVALRVGVIVDGLGREALSEGGHLGRDLRDEEMAA